MTPSTLISTDLRCMAPHPDRHKRPDLFTGRSCNNLIITLPFLVRWTGKWTHRRDHIRLGMIPGFCNRCKNYSEFEVVAPTEEDECSD